MPHAPQVLARGGISLVATPHFTYMAEEVQKELAELGLDDTEMHTIKFKRFPCSEVKPKIIENVRQKDVYLFYDFKNGVFNDDLMNLFLTLNALHLAGAKSITLVVPFLPYMRQDRKDEPRVPISAAIVIRMLELTPSLKQLITIDMHADQLQAVFTIQTDHLPGSTVMAPWIKERFAADLAADEVVFVAPDFGSAKRVRKLADAVQPNLGIAILEKQRGAEDVEILNIIGASVSGKICIVNDDMMDTCGTIILAAETLYAQGAKQVVLTATHPIFSPKDGTTAYEKLEAANVEVVVTDSLASNVHSWLTVLPLAKFMARTIKQHVTKDGSISNLIKEGLSQ